MLRRCIVEHVRGNLRSVACGEALGPTCCWAEGLLERNLLKRSRTELGCWYLAGNGKEGSPRDARIPHPCVEIGCARSSNSEADRGSSRELSIRRGSKGCSALMSDADELQISCELRGSKGVGEPEVRVADHAEHSVNSAIYESVDHLRHQRLVVFLRFDNGDVDTVIAQIDLVGGDLVIERSRGFAGDRVVLPAVPWTDQPAALHQPFSEGPALMRTAIRNRTPSGLAARKRDRVVSGLDHSD